MNNDNDKRILSLKEQIKKNKEELKKSNKRFIPQTNCTLRLGSEEYNLNVCDVQTLTLLYVRLESWVSWCNHSQIEDVDEVGILPVTPDEVIVSGYPITLWVEDIANKIRSLKYKETKRKLDQLEDELTKLLSDDKQTELKIDGFVALLDELMK